MVRASVRHHICKFLSQSTQERSHTNVSLVVKASLRFSTLKSIRDLIQETKHTNVIYVIRALITVHIFKDIGEFTLEINPYKCAVHGEGFS